MEENIEKVVDDIQQLITKTKESTTIIKYERNLQELNRFCEKCVFNHPNFQEFNGEEWLLKLDDEIMELIRKETWLNVCVGRLENLFIQEEERIKNNFYYFQKKFGETYSIFFCWNQDGTQETFMVSTNLKSLDELEICVNSLEHEFERLNLFKIIV